MGSQTGVLQPSVATSSCPCPHLPLQPKPAHCRSPAGCPCAVGQWMGCGAAFNSSPWLQTPWTIRSPSASPWESRRLALSQAPHVPRYVPFLSQCHSLHPEDFRGSIRLPLAAWETLGVLSRLLSLARAGCAVFSWACQWVNSIPLGPPAAAAAAAISLTICIYTMCVRLSARISRSAPWFLVCVCAPLLILPAGTAPHTASGLHRLVCLQGPAPSQLVSAGFRAIAFLGQKLSRK